MFYEYFEIVGLLCFVYLIISSENCASKKAEGSSYRPSSNLQSTWSDMSSLNDIIKRSLDCK